MPYYTVWVITWLSAALWHSNKKSEIWQTLLLLSLIQVTQCHLYKCHCPLAQVQVIGTHPSNIPDCYRLRVKGQRVSLILLQGEYKLDAINLHSLLVLLEKYHICLALIQTRHARTSDTCDRDISFHLTIFK